MFPPTPFIDEYRRVGGLHKTCLLAPRVGSGYRVCELEVVGPIGKKDGVGRERDVNGRKAGEGWCVVC